jgi:23S rRNA (adenine-N6)-dimethyltransferase
VPASGQQHWGWHALDDRWARRIVAAAAIEPGDLVLDIGAGTGALTALLVSAGARVIAVELHPRRAEVLRCRFADEQVTVVRADASDLRLPTKPFKVVANPPYGLLNAIVKRLVGNGSRLQSADLVVPSWFVTRVCDGELPGTRRWAGTFDVGRGLTVPARAFTPAPRVGSAVPRIQRARSTRR